MIQLDGGIRNGESIEQIVNISGLPLPPADDSMATRAAFLSTEQPAVLIDRLRQKLSSVEQATGLTGECGTPLDLGIAAIDAALGGGLAGGALHEIAAVRESEVPAATGFALAAAARWARKSRQFSDQQASWPCLSPQVEFTRLAALNGADLEQARGRMPSTSLGVANQVVDGRNKSGHDGSEISGGRAVLWIAEDLSLWENGAPYGPGLDAAGISPEQLITVAAARARDVLWAMEEALRCRAVGVVIGEIRARGIDQAATRRLSLAAAAGDTLGLLLRTAPDDAPAAFATRWIIGAAPSSLLSPSERCHGIGPPRLAVRLVRNRRGHLGAWIVEWNSVEQRFELATHSELMAGAAFDRPHRAAGA
jgi:protein ImuA